MGAIRKYNPEDRILSYCRRVHNRAAGNENDDIRLNDVQRYAGVVAILKCDPAIMVAKIIQLCMDERSKWNVDVYTLHRMTVDLHHMITATPDQKSRKPGSEDNQFELDFQWNVGSDGERVAGLVQEAAE